MICVTVYGRPQPAGSKKAFGNKTTGRAVVVDDAKGSRPWKQQVAGAARDAMTVGRHSKFTGPVGLEVTFFLRRPKSHLGSGKNADVLKASAPAYPTTRPDATKLLRCVEDALTDAGVWADDAQVIHQCADKRFGYPERCEIRVWAGKQPSRGLLPVGQWADRKSARQRGSAPGPAPGNEVLMQSDSNEPAERITDGLIAQGKAAGQASQRWVNAVIEITVPLDDVSVSASKWAKIKAAEAAVDELIEVLPREGVLANHAIWCHWEDVEDGEPLAEARSTADALTQLEAMANWAETMSDPVRNCDWERAAKIAQNIRAALLCLSEHGE